MALIALVSMVCFSASTLAEGTFFKKKRSAAQSVPAAAPVAPAPQPEPEVAPLPAGPEQQLSGSASMPTEVSHVTQESAARAISGNVDQVVSTGTLTVAGQQVELLGVRGETTMVDGLVRWLAANGNQVTCEPAGARYRCRNPRGADVAQVVLMNGAGRANGEAPAEYREAEAQARAQRKGVWAAQ